MNSTPLNIAVIGGGVAGITAAHILQRDHNITMFEKNGYLGGHTNTVVINEGPDEGAAVDTGFIVCNDQTYPHFHRLLEQLNILVRNSDMSFGFHCEKTGLQYCGDNFNTLFAQRKNLLNLSYWKLLSDIMRFGKLARAKLEQNSIVASSLGEFVELHGFSTMFIENYLLPMGAAIWSTPSRDIMKFPAQTFIQFFHNHGLLSLKPPQWQTVIGGSQSYVKSFCNHFKGTIILDHAVNQISRSNTHVNIQFANGETRQFDKAVLASHADESYSILGDPSPDEKRLLGKWRYTKNKVVLHTDDSVMPPLRRAWASWNYKREDAPGGEGSLTMTYNMNQLMGLRTQNNYYVTLNSQKPVKEESVVREIHYTHPMYDNHSVSTQTELSCLNGKNNTYYCGSYFGYGFHEDAVKSGIEVAKHFGLDL